MYRRIIVPLDGSKLAELALPEAERLARLTRAPLHLIRIVDVTQLPWYGAYAASMDPETYEGAKGEEKRLATEYLHSVATPYIDTGVVVNLDVRQGRTVPQLVAYAQPGDLIVMASHGRGGISRWFLGSVAEDLLRHATVPVLLIRAGTAGQDTIDTEAAEVDRGANGREPERASVAVASAAGMAIQRPDVPVDGW